MLDYEIIDYEVLYLRKESCSDARVRFETEEEAINFIKENRNKWCKYKLVKTEVGIIDF